MCIKLILDTVWIKIYKSLWQNGTFIRNFKIFRSICRTIKLKISITIVFIYVVQEFTLILIRKRVTNYVILFNNFNTNIIKDIQEATLNTRTSEDGD